MFKHILLPTDGSPLSAEAVNKAMSTAKALGARVTAVNVVDQYHRAYAQYQIPELALLKERFDEQMAERANKILDEAKQAAANFGVQCNTVVAINDWPHEAIIEQAEKSGCDLIVMASHGRQGLAGVLLGSETQKVLVHSKIPVLVCR